MGCQTKRSICGPAVSHPSPRGGCRNHQGSTPAAQKKKMSSKRECDAGRQRRVQLRLYHQPGSTNVRFQYSVRGRICVVNLSFVSDIFIQGSEHINFLPHSLVIEANLASFSHIFACFLQQSFDMEGSSSYLALMNFGITSVSTII